MESVIFCAQPSLSKDFNQNPLSPEPVRISLRHLKIASIHNLLFLSFPAPMESPL